MNIISVISPLIIVGLLGFITTKSRWFSKDHIAALSKFTFYLSIPAFLFLQMATADLTNINLKIYAAFYVPVLIGSVSQMESNWFNGFNEKYFYDRGRFSRNTLGLFWGLLYIIYFVLLKKTIYQKDIQPHKAFYYSMTGYIFRSYEV